MNQLTVTENNQTLDSREVAEMVGKEHNKLMRDIRTYIDQLNQSNLGHVEFFRESSYQDGKGEIRPCYEVTRKGCEFIANKIIGIKGTEFTAKYINRFHAMEETIQTSILDSLSPELQAIFAHDRKLQVFESRVDKLENTMTVDYGQAKEIESIRKSRAISILGGINSLAYQQLSGKVFRAIGHDYKEFFNINAYSNTPVAKFAEAKHYLKNWVPDNNLQLLINAANRGDLL